MTEHDDPVVLGPSSGVPELDERKLSTLAQVGHHWRNAVADTAAWHDALPVDPGLRAAAPDPRGRFSRVEFVRDGADPDVEATPHAGVMPTAGGRTLNLARRLALGRPLRSTAVLEERMRKVIALPVLSSDALSSVAYGPEAMLVVLVLAGSAGLALSLPIAAAIVVLMIAVGLSYRQTIRAYPRGGGSYIVASDNLGPWPGMIAAAGLMLDYVLTVAVSVAAGVAAITSAIPELAPDRVPLGLAAIAILLAGNLRGVRQAGAIFASPTYAFILAIALLVVVGVVDAAGRGFAATPHPPVHAVEGLSLLVVLRAFSSGATAMTGIEAISDGVPSFRPVEWRNARTTLTLMVSLLVAMFVGTIALIELDGIVPSSSQTVLSQLAHLHLGSGVLYAYVQAATALILLLAANTAYSDFPRLLFFLARDFRAPRLFLRLGDRLAFSNGIIVLSVAAAAIYVAFSGRTESLIPLFAVGVFLAFTLSQSGMVMFWRRKRGPNWRRALTINAIGAGLSAIVLVITGVTKFTEGAWLVVILVPLLACWFWRIRVHYDAVGRAIELHRIPVNDACRAVIPVATAGLGSQRKDEIGRAEGEESPDELAHLIVVPLASMDLAGMRTLAYAASLGQPMLAIHLSPDDDDADRFRRYWKTWGDLLPLQIVDSPYRSLVVPTTRYLEALHAQRPDLTITVLLPELIVRGWHRILHNQLDVRLRRALRNHPGIVVSTVPFHIPDG
jgi:amino acid transporter